MENDQDLIQALRQDGIEPTEEEIAKLDAQITALAEFLIDLFAFRKVQRANTDQDGEPPDEESLGSQQNQS